jgi:hypothetical protein
MLQILQRTASRLRPAAPVLAAAGVLSLIAVAALLLLAPGAAAEAWLRLAIVALLWSLCGYVFIQAFQQIPPPPDAAMGAWQRLSRRLARGWLWLLALVFVGTTIAAVLLTNRLVTDALD